jgi:hypothetical protein
VGVAQLGAGLGLAPEARHHGGVGDVVRVEHLERHLAARRHLAPLEHGAEAPLADLAADDVAVVERAADELVERRALDERGRHRGGRRRRAAAAGVGGFGRGLLRGGPV